VPASSPPASQPGARASREMMASMNPGAGVLGAQSELLSAAELLLSVSPMFKPQPQRDRSMSLLSLETLVDVASRADFSLGPASTANDEPAAKAHAYEKKAKASSSCVRGRSLLQDAVSPRQHKPSCTCGRPGCGSAPATRASTLLASAKATANPSKGASSPASTPSASPSTSPSASPSLRATRLASALARSAQPANFDAPVFPSVLPAKYRGVYFKDGRVGIYCGSQRRQLIDKFVAKRNRRVWSKKVRYSCRKSLAQQRIRIKGRFVKTTEQLRAFPENGADDGSN